MEAKDPRHSLAALPDDILLLVTGHLCTSLTAVARLRQTCRALANRTLYTCHRDAHDFRTIQAVADWDFAAFRIALLNSGIVTDSRNDPNSQLDMMRRGRQLLQVCIWHLVANHNEGSQLWWHALDSLVNNTEVCFMDPRRHLGVLNSIECANKKFLEYTVKVAIGRRHSVGLSALAAFCKRNECWINSLDVYDAAMAMVRASGDLNSEQSGPSLDMQLALIHLTWFEHDDDDDDEESSSERACTFLAMNGHPQVVLEGIVSLGSLNAPSRHASVIDSFPELVAACWTHGHRDLVFLLLDMFLLAHGSEMNQEHPLLPPVSGPSFGQQLSSLYDPPTKPKAQIVFPKDAQSARRQVFRQLGSHGVSHDQCYLALLGLRKWKWATLIDWFEADEDDDEDSLSTRPDPQLLAWYLSRTRIQLHHIHKYGHEIRHITAELAPAMSAELVSSILASVPLDLVHVHTDDSQADDSCCRCDQLTQLAARSTATQHLRDFTGYRRPQMINPVQGQPRPLSFEPIPLVTRIQRARSIQNLLASVPPPTPAIWSTLAARGVAVAPPSRPTPWRTYFSLLAVPDANDPAGYNRGRDLIIHFWPHVCHLDPSTAVNVIPFEDYMWALLKCHLFAFAVQVLQDAPRTERFTSWRLTKDVWVDIDGEKPLGSEWMERERMKFIKHVQVHRLIIV